LNDWERYYLVKGGGYLTRYVRGMKLTLGGVHDVLENETLKKCYKNLKSQRKIHKIQLPSQFNFSTSRRDSKIYEIPGHQFFLQSNIKWEMKCNFHKTFQHILFRSSRKKVCNKIKKFNVMKKVN